MPSQHVSFRGTRTTFAFQEAIACTDAESAGPSKMPQPCAQAYSAPERFTPRSRTGCPRESTSRVPCTCTVGAPDDGGGGGGGGGVAPLVEAAGLLRQPASVLNVSRTTRRRLTPRMLSGQRCLLKRSLLCQSEATFEPAQDARPSGARLALGNRGRAWTETRTWNAGWHPTAPRSRLRP